MLALTNRVVLVLVKLLCSEIVPSKQLNSVLSQRAKLYLLLWDDVGIVPYIPTGNLACVANLARHKANIAESDIVYQKN